ncbi:MAG TPA: ArsR family transcriptional regulator [Candidatus Thermoplasmatota archaeon]|jgi:predicted transcriptional regulator|nr:ArsR family transcriptional regulator [Candidatus Thermoplasmatota archaeon]
MSKDSGDAVRLRICQFVRANPGAHFRAIQRGLELSPGQTVHHLRRLVQDSMLAERRVARYTHYFPAGAPQGSRAAVGALRQSARRAIAEHAAEQPRTTRELVAATGLATSTLHHHLHVLLEAGVLRPEGPRPMRYALTPEGHEALQLLAGLPVAVSVEASPAGAQALAYLVGGEDAGEAVGAEAPPSALPPA